jgi:glucan phosphoethanolaminetransferase (alkaline phosphatase superfamily)
LLLIIFPFIIKNKKEIYIPNAFHLAYLNTLFAVDLNLINKFSNTHQKFLPYKVVKIDGGKPIVIAIMGESLNFRYMHLFGYKKENTPYLDSLKKIKISYIKKQLAVE